MKSYAITESLFIDCIQGINDIKVMNKQIFFKGYIKTLWIFSR